MTNQQEPSSPEFQLRFPALKGKDTPTGYIHIDEALDRLGKERLPDRWGKGAAWKLQPFRRVTDEGEIEVVRFRREDSKDLVRRANKATEVPREELLACQADYEKVREELRPALEQGLVKAWVYTPDGNIAPLENKGLWTYQRAKIFYTGHCRQEVNGLRRKFRILIEAASFEKWLRGPAEPPKGLGDETAQKIVSILTQAAQAHDCRLSFDRTFATVRDERQRRGPPLSKSTFRDKVWKRLDAKVKATRGRVESEQGAKENKLLSDEELRRQICSVRQPPNTGSQTSS